MSKSSVIQFPQSQERITEAEQTVLGSILLDSKFAWPLVDPLLNAADFSVPRNKVIYQAIQTISQTLTPIDLMTVSDHLHHAGLMEAAGGPAFLSDLTWNVGSAANVEYFAKVVRDDSRRRDYVAKAKTMAAEAEKNKLTFSELLEKHEQLFYQTSREYFRSGYTIRTAGDIAADELRRIEEVSAGNIKIQGVKTGFYDLDKFTNGFHPGELIFLAARPGVGKTALALNFALNCQEPVGFFSLEMTESELIKRQLACLSGVDSYFLKTMRLNGEQWILVTQAASDLIDRRLYIDDKPLLSLQEFRSKARQLKSKHNAGLLIIDYLQIMKASRGRSRNEEIGEISAGLKAAAKELSAPVLCLAQLNREVEKRPSKKPQLSDLRESGSIEQDADQVIFLWADKYDDPYVNFQVAKNRNGRTGQGKLFFDKAITKFRDWEED